MINITRNTEIADLVTALPEAVTYMNTKGIRCIRRGQPVWGSIEDLLRLKNLRDKDVNKCVTDLKGLAEK